jgi:hypothetical protein
MTRGTRRVSRPVRTEGSKIPNAQGPGRKAPRPPTEPPAPPRVRRRQKTARVAVRKGTTLLEMQPRPSEIPGVTKRKIGQH